MMIYFFFLCFTSPVLSSVELSWNISKSCESLKLEAIFLCLVRLLLASASEIWFISQTSWDSSWTPIMQCSAEPCRNLVTSLMTALNTNSSLSLSNQPSLVMREKRVTMPWTTNWASLG